MKISLVVWVAYLVFYIIQTSKPAIGAALTVIIWAKPKDNALFVFKTVIYALGDTNSILIVLRIALQEQT
jgi:hypothetical protein